MAGLNVEDPIATYLVALFEDDSSPKTMQFLAAAMPLGPAPTTQMRLFGTMTASPPIAFFFAGSNHWHHLQIPANLLILRRIDLLSKYMNYQRGCLQVVNL